MIRDRGRIISKHNWSDEGLSAVESGGKVGVDLCVTQVTVVPTDLGPMMIGGSDRGVRQIAFGEDVSQVREQLNYRFPAARYGMTSSLRAWAIGLQKGIQHPRAELKLTLEFHGTPFQQQVWSALQEIPVGQTESYAQLACRLGKPTASRAVAGACAANRLALAVPCHRVIRSDGKLGGYRWGLERKKELLKREHSIARRNELATQEYLL